MRKYFIMEHHMKCNNPKFPITFLINSLCEGGAERAMLTLSKNFITQGHKVTILALTKNNFYEIPKGVNVVYLSEMNDKVSGLLKMFYMPYHAWKLKKYIHKNKIGVVQSYLFRSNFINLLSGMLGAKHAVQVVNRSVVSRFFAEGLSGKINIFLMKYLYPRADLIVHISKQMKIDFNQHFFSTKNEKVIYNPYDVEAILAQANEEVENFVFESHKRYLVAVGRLIELKRFEDIIEALTKLDSDLELILLGDGSQRDSLQSLVKGFSLEKRVHFLGQVQNPFKYIKRSDLFISSSQTEGFPNVLVESMLCETMVISSDCLSGPREILSPNSDCSIRLVERIEMCEFGILYPVGGVGCLVEAIREVLEDDALRYSYQEKALQRAKLFSVKNIAQTYAKVLNYV
jgi:N-acetylgalactosamine-N,N'-diacetylbacillosaminyl-diphospho-undecaprenol 4-alpha-N-acetylgalactosaminyltransferase